MTTTHGSMAALQAWPADLTNPTHFEQFVLAYSSVVQTVCLRMLRDRSAAEDACQETFAAAWRNRDHLQPNRAWLLKVATNKCLDELRWRTRYRQNASDEPTEDDLSHIVTLQPSPESTVLSAEAQAVLRQALLQLPWAQRVAVVLCDVEDWSYLEIAKACDVSIGTVKSRIFRGRRALREVLNSTNLF